MGRETSIYIAIFFSTTPADNNLTSWFSLAVTRLLTRRARMRRLVYHKSESGTSVEELEFLKLDRQNMF